MTRPCNGRRHNGDRLDVLFGDSGLTLCTDCVQPYVDERAPMADDGAKAQLLHNAHRLNQVVVYGVLWVYRTNLDAGEPAEQSFPRSRGARRKSL